MGQIIIVLIVSLEIVLKCLTLIGLNVTFDKKYVHFIAI
jgi:hypothetical protein